MNLQLLRAHIGSFKKRIQEDPTQHEAGRRERAERSAYYSAWTADRLLTMKEHELYEYIAKLWAMLMWGNKRYVVDTLLERHGLDAVRHALATLIWGEVPLTRRWEDFRKSIKGMGPGMMSELLAYTHPKECMIWNRRAYVGLKYLGVSDLPRYDYQVTGQKYVQLSSIAKTIADELRAADLPEADLLAADGFIWEELQVAESLAKVFEADEAVATDKKFRGTEGAFEFIHDEVRDKLRDIGQWLGLNADTERLVAAGSKVDTVWEVTIGNMGRVIYVFEVQTKGSVDSLIVNLLKALNNPAVQGVVAVSDEVQLERIRRHAEPVAGLGTKLKYWNYRQVLEVHKALEAVNEAINKLGLVPHGYI